MLVPLLGHIEQETQVSAIAAGNAAVLKPSEQTPALSQLLADLVPKYLDPELYAVINGGIPEATKVCSRDTVKVDSLIDGRNSADAGTSMGS